MKTDIIQLVPEDDVLSTREKMAWRRGQRVVLVWPVDGAPLLERKVELAQLRQAARSLGIELALAVRPGPVGEQACELGIPVFEHVIAAQKCLRWPKTQPRQAPENRQGIGELRSLQSAYKARPEVEWPVRIGPVGYGLGAAAVIALLIFLLPSASVSLKMQPYEQQLSLELWAGPSVNEANLAGGLPAGSVNVFVSGEDSASSSGQITLADQYASGRLTIFNLSGEALELPAGLVARTLTDPPVRFQTTADLLLPPGPSAEGIEVGISALLPGSQGNLPAAAIRQIEGDTGLNLRVENLEPTAGGSERSVPAPTENDVANLRRRILQSLESEAIQQLNAIPTSERIVLAPSLSLRSVLFEQAQPAIGQPGDRVKYSMQAEFTAWTVQQVDIENAAVRALDALLPEGYTAVAESMRVQAPNPAEMQLDGDRVRWTAQVNRSMTQAWNPAEVRRDLSGRTPQEALQALQTRFSLQEAPQVRMSPAWWPWMPFAPFRIAVAGR